jgi:hypothetical protein
MTENWIVVQSQQREPILIKPITNLDYGYTCYCQNEQSRRRFFDDSGGDESPEKRSKVGENHSVAYSLTKKQNTVSNELNYFVVPRLGLVDGHGAVGWEFLKTATWQQVSADGNRQIAPVIPAITAAEGMEGHAITARIRLSKTETYRVE